MNKKHRFNWIVYAVFSSLLMSGCSDIKYQSYRESGSANQLLSGQQWEIQLPYESENDLVIEAASGNELLISEAQDEFHLVRISLGKDGKPEDVKQIELDYGESCEILDNGLILVSGKQDDEIKEVALVSRDDMSVRYSFKLPFTEATDFSIPGSIQIGDAMILYQSAVKIDKESWSDGVYIHEVPYVAWSKYDMHVVNMANGKVVSFPGVASHSIPRLSDVVARSKEAVMAESRSPLSFAGSSKKKEINKHIYMLDQFFVVDQGGLLIFSLANFEGDKLYYSLDLRGGAQTPELRAPSELASKYPDELTVTRSPSKKKQEKRQLTISGRTYRIERAAFLPSGFVVVASEAFESSLLSDDDKYYSNRKVIMGIKPGAGTGTESFERVWEYSPRYVGTIGSLLEDSKGGAIYFPDLTGDSSESFKVLGLAVADGKVLAGFPANFKENKEEKQLRIVGTSVDFQRNLLYIHDSEKNRIVCASLR